MNLHTLGEAFKAGGVTLVVILVSSVMALAIGVERLVALWRFLDRARSLGETIKRCLYRGALVDARAACERSTSMVAEFYLVGFERHGRSSPEAVAAAVDRERQRVTLTLKGQLWILATIGSLTPFVGLFGTVWGILRAFEQIGITKQAGIDVVGPGIAEALVATAAGLLAAIEAMAIYNYFMARLARVQVELKLMAEEFIELLKEQKPEPLASSKPVEAELPAKAAAPSEA
jgi:biopolymer transport protein ExbB